MAYNTRMVMLMAILQVACEAAVATEFIVGGELGWRRPNAVKDYSIWANTSNVMVGDSLVFRYDPSLHDVLSVTGAAFAECNSSEPLEQYKDGNTTITFDKPGRFWFICGTPNHCSAGQAFKVTIPPATEGSTPVSQWQTGVPPASAPAPEAGAGNSLVESSKSVLIISSIILGAFYLL